MFLRFGEAYLTELEIESRKLHTYSNSSVHEQYTTPADSPSELCRA